MQMKATLSLYQRLLLVSTHTSSSRGLVIINFSIKLLNKCIIQTAQPHNNLSSVSYYHTVAPVVDSAANMHKLPTCFTTSFSFPYPYNPAHVQSGIDFLNEIPEIVNGRYMSTQVFISAKI